MNVSDVRDLLQVCIFFIYNIVRYTTLMFKYAWIDNW